MKIIEKILKWLFPSLFYEESSIEEPKNHPDILYIRKDFLTKSEVVFYKKLVKIEEFGYKVIPQVNLATVIKKVSNQKYQNELFKNIDFGIFDSNFNLLLFIELNDSSHKKMERQKRDLRVKKICNDAQIKLIKFYTDYPNEEKYVIERTLKELRYDTLNLEDD